MKTLFQIITCPLIQKLLLCIVFALAYSTSHAQVSTMIFPIKPEDQNYLRYLYFRNQFDSAEITCFFGEYRLINGGNTTRINIINAMPHNAVLEGDSAQGENSNLLPYSRTENFTMPPSGTSQLSFYRNMTLYNIPCGSGGGGAGGGEVGEGGVDGNGSHWLIGQGKIHDKTEFVTKLIRASDNAVLAVLDSVGVNTNPSSDTVFVYGTSPVKTKQTRILPTGYGGTSVYLQLSPRRYGSTPFGIDLKHYCDVPWNFSSVIDSMGHGSQDSTLEDSILIVQKTLLFNYCDSIISATGHLPQDSIMDRFLVEPPVMDSFFFRYYDSHTLPNGKKYYTVKSGYAKSSSMFDNSNKKNGIVCANNMCKIKDAEIQRIQPSPTSGATQITINAYKNVENAALDVYTLSGQKIAQQWSGTLLKGNNVISVNFSDYANGTYGIYCNNQDGQTIDFDKVIIAK